MQKSTKTYMGRLYLEPKNAQKNHGKDITKVYANFGAPFENEQLFADFDGNEFIFDQVCTKVITYK